MSDEEHLDIDPCDKDEPGESKAAKAAVKAADAKVAKKAADAKEKNFQDAIAQKAVVDAAQKEIDDILAGLKPDQKAKLLAAQGVVATPVDAKKRAPKGAHKTKCDDALEKIKPTIKYIEDIHTEHVELFLLGLFVKDRTDALPESDDHDAFKHWLTDNKESMGLKKQTRKSVTPAASPAVSKNVSRAASVALNTSFENDEEAGAGAK